jgi:hypothetical protein
MAYRRNNGNQPMKMAAKYHVISKISISEKLSEENENESGINEWLIMAWRNAKKRIEIMK